VEKKFLAGLSKIPNYKDKKYLLAISGGVDSVVLAFLMNKHKLNVHLAHCNFKLRAKESDEDEYFVKNLANSLNLPLHLKKCKVSTNQNTQLAAREMRYEWFEQIQKDFSFDYILTAHHLNDAIETFFINLFRGSGLKGLSGIPENDTYLRPLLNIKRQEILSFAQENQLKWREDSSNASQKYLRNQIRHSLIPEIKKLTPHFEHSMEQTFSHLQEANSIIKEWFGDKKKELIQIKQENEILDIEALNKMKNPQAFLYYWLNPYQFSDWKSINALPTAQTGKRIENKNYFLLKQGKKIILSTKTEEKEISPYVYHELPSQINQPIPMSFEVLDKKDISMEEIINQEKNIVYIDYDKITFPIILRKKQEGDSFYPLGMKGKKKLSDFYKDEKISLPEKEKIWLFCDTKNIIWVSGKRLDERYKISENTKRILKIKML